MFGVFLCPIFVGSDPAYPERISVSDWCDSVLFSPLFLVDFAMNFVGSNHALRIFLFLLYNFRTLFFFGVVAKAG